MQDDVVSNVIYQGMQLVEVVEPEEQNPKNVACMFVALDVCTHFHKGNLTVTRRLRKG